MCNCSTEAGNHYLLESLAACDNANSKLNMYFTVNTALVNYLDMFPNLTESLRFPLIKNRTIYKQILPITLHISGFDKTLLTAPTKSNDFMNNYARHEEIFGLQERHETTILNTKKISFLTITSWTFLY